MSWMAWMRWQLEDRRVESLVLEIASRCRKSILERTVRQLDAMSLAKAMGYYRARLAAIVPVHAAQVIREEALPREVAAWIAAPAREEVIRQFLHDAQRRSGRFSMHRRAA